MANRLFSPMIVLGLFVLFYTPFCFCLNPDVPLNLIQTHIKGFANFSVDPCDDFYVHVCSSKNIKGSFMRKLHETKQTIIDNVKSKDSFLKTLKLDTIDDTDVFLLLLDVGKLTTHCEKTAEKPKPVKSKEVKSLEEFPNFKNSTCQEKSKMVINLLQTGIEYNFLRRTLVHAVNAWIMNEQIKDMTHTFTDKIDEVICEVLATKRVYNTLKAPISSLSDYDNQAIVLDKLQMWNSEDNLVYMGNDWMLMFHTNFTSDMYGSVGFTILHEIMHTFVFDANDFAFNKTLAQFWTKNGDCVAEQALKTCQNFPTILSEDGSLACNTTETFEEDAADLAAYRIAWDSYKKALARKVTVPNYQSLDVDQLFFYGAAVMYCTEDGLNNKPNSHDPHSNDYQRLLSLVSQMDSFSDAFQCKKEDKMIKNKGPHCELYGDGAPISR